jgi:hypothetical protein
MSWINLRFFDENYEFEFQFRKLEEIKTKAILAIIGVIVGNIYLEFFFWTKNLKINFRWATYCNEFGLCFWMYVIFFHR